MTKNTAVGTHLNLHVPFFLPFRIELLHLLLLLLLWVKISIFDLHLRTQGDDEAQAVFFYSDLSSELMLVPHILFINLTG